MSELDCPVTPWRRGVASLHRLRCQPARCPGLAVGLSHPGGLLAARHWLPGLEVRRCRGAAILWRWAVRELVAAVKDGVRAALDDLRDLARGIYPPLLADQGLVPALQAQARKASLQVEIDTDGIGRYPQDTEAAVYFCTLEALQNITKYASASRAKVDLSCSDDSLRFTVTDNGSGFDTAATRYGTGLQGMADRLAALGGALQVRSQPGHGTMLSGELPLPHLVADLSTCMVTRAIAGWP